jgi:hypothetical protein
MPPVLLSFGLFFRRGHTLLPWVIFGPWSAYLHFSSS